MLTPAGRKRKEGILAGAYVLEERGLQLDRLRLARRRGLMVTGMVQLLQTQS